MKRLDFRPPRSLSTRLTLAFSCALLVASPTRESIAQNGERIDDIARKGSTRQGGPGGLTGGNFPTDWTYYATGLQPAWLTAGATLGRGFVVSDDNVAGGQLIHSAESGGGTGKDSWSGVVNLPFFFRFYGVPYDRFCVNKTGLLTFDVSVAGSETFIRGQAGGWGRLTLHANDGRSADGETLVIGGIERGDVAMDEANLTPGNTTDPLGLPHPDLPNNTIAYFWGPFLPLSSDDDIYLFIYGQAPNRQAWVINAGHRKKGNLNTYTAVVLEETTDRIFVVDMSTTTPDVSKGFLTVGVQRDPETARQVLASPKIPVVSATTSPLDNGFYLLQPYRRYEMVSGEGHSSLDAIDMQVFDLMDVWNIPGATVAASQGGRLVFAKAYGFANVETHEAMQPTHRAGIGSVSKILTTIGIMRLRELADAAGIPFSLDDLLYGESGLLAPPDYEDNIAAGIASGVADGDYAAGSEDFWDAAYHSIRLRHLLTHTAGFNGNGDVEGTAETFGIPYEDVTYSDAHRHFLETRPLLSPPPGTMFGDPGSIIAFPPPAPAAAYSNHGLGLCGHIIQVVSGVPYIDFLQTYVFGPLNLDVVHTQVEYAELTDLDSKRYHYYDGGLPYQISSFNGGRVYGAYGYKRGDLGAASGGWVMTARDLVRVMCATDQLSNQSDILTAESLNEMESVPYPEIDAGQAHGWDTNAEGKLAKNGRVGFGAAYMAKYPSGINVAVVINTGADSDLLRVQANAVEAIVASGAVPFNYDLFDGGTIGN